LASSSDDDLRKKSKAWINISLLLLGKSLDKNREIFFLSPLFAGIFATEETLLTFKNTLL
jgi:hypothetical protein